MLGLAPRVSLPFSGTWKLPVWRPRMGTSSDLQSGVRPRLQMGSSDLREICYRRKQARDVSPPQSSPPAPHLALLQTVRCVQGEGEQGNPTCCLPLPSHGIPGAWKCDAICKGTCPKFGGMTWYCAFGKDRRRGLAQERGVALGFGAQTGATPSGSEASWPSR